MNAKVITPIPNTKYLDYNGLKYYDTKLKEWVNGKGIPIGTREVNGAIEVDKAITFNTPVALKGDSTAENLIVSGDVKMLNAAVGYSDRRLKTDIRNIEGLMNKILSLSVCRYRPNEIAQRAGIVDKEEIGLIADEVAELFPEFIEESPVTDILNSSVEYKTIDYARMSAVLVKAIQELHEEQNIRLMEIESRLTALEK